MKRKALIFIILAGVLWGTSGIFVNIWSGENLATVQIAALRTMLSFPCFLLYTAFFNKEALRARLKDLPLYLGSGITLFTTASFYYSSMQKTSIATAVILMYMAPALVLAWSVAFFGEKLTVKKGLAVLCMLIGCVLVSGITGGMRLNLSGVLMGLLSGLSYGIYNILTKIQMRRKCNPITATLYSFFFAAILAASLCDFSAIGTLLLSRPAFTLLLGITHALVTFVIPYFLYTLSLKALPAGVASAMAIIEPMSATVFSIVIFHEPLSVFSAIGIVFILGSVLVLSREDG